MATLYITEYSSVAMMELSGGAGYVPVASSVPIVQSPAVANQTVAIGGTSVPSAAFNAATKIIRVQTDTTCSIVVGGTAPVATAASGRFPANSTEYFGTQGGDKLAVISNV